MPLIPHMEFRIIHRRGTEFAEEKVFDYESSELCELCVSMVSIGSEFFTAEARSSK
jgi:hypothetical protein